MNTQNTPVHIRLWHREFWLMACAVLALSMSVYILLPVLPKWLMMSAHQTPQETGLQMGIFALGLYLFGGHCSWLVQQYRRNVVCMWAVAVLAADLVLLWYIDHRHIQDAVFGWLLLQRFLFGAFFGLAQMVLSSTLIIDTSESYLRTEANHSASWFSRFAMSIGPLAGLLLYQYYGFQTTALCAIGCALLSIVFIKMVTFPFRAPEEGIRLWSLDRFFLPHGFPLFVNLLLYTIVVGLLFSSNQLPEFYALMMGGFLLALLAQRFVFRDAELKSEVVTGLLLMLAALLVLLVAPQSPVAPLLVGISIGLIGSRFLLFFIKLSRHCQRGTSQSTFFLGWETGIALGMGAGYMWCYNQVEQLLYVSLFLVAIALALYHFLTHSWFMHHKNR